MKSNGVDKLRLLQDMAGVKRKLESIQERVLELMDENRAGYENAMYSDRVTENSCGNCRFFNHDEDHNFYCVLSKVDKTFPMSCKNRKEPWTREELKELFYPAIMEERRKQEEVAMRAEK